VKWDIPQVTLNSEEKSKIESVFSAYAPLKHDPWGASLATLLKVSPPVKFLYENYFRVIAHNLDSVPEGPVIFIANHGGQIPVDGMMVGYSLLLKAKKNRLVRTMVERWVPSLPFIGSFFMKMGQIVGDQKNCLQLLKNQQSVLVFPEGVKGSGKTIDKRYQLQDFGSGFYRLAIEAKVPIVPIVLVGTEETYPSFMNFKALAKLLRAPYFPVTPSFPLLGPIGMLPLPTKISIKYLPAHIPTLNTDASDVEIEAEIESLHLKMQKEINIGLKNRASEIFSKDAFHDT